MDIRMTSLAFQSAMACFMCGEQLEPDVEIATAYTRTELELGPICTRCMESDGPSLRRRVQHHVVSVRRELAVLEHLVGEDQALLDWHSWRP